MITFSLKITLFNQYSPPDSEFMAVKIYKYYLNTFRGTLKDGDFEDNQSASKNDLKRIVKLKDRYFEINFENEYFKNTISYTDCCWGPVLGNIQPCLVRTFEPRLVRFLPRLVQTLNHILAVKDVMKFRNYHLLPYLTNVHIFY